MGPQQDHPEFSVARHGYDRTQVRRYVDRLVEEHAGTTAERDEARARAEELEGQLQLARREITALTERLDKIGNAAAASSAPNAAERAARTIATAEAQAGEIVARAQSAADTAWSAAEAASAELRERYRTLFADVEKRHTELHEAHVGLMAEAKAKSEAMTTAATTRQRTTDDQAERDRQRQEQQFQQELATRRAALDDETTTRRAESEAEATRRITEATDEAAKRIAAATSQVEQLTALREQLAGRLRGTSDLLNQSAQLLEPIEAEIDLDPVNTEAPTAKNLPIPQKATQP
ncbi:cell division septum initiation protein DivIVA [Actinokineospora baliensis]|uniref:DivIVA domain-containing protein n=1 Tax=Actinokineospora baliensis TaxID=547056 RepID=UPI001959F749|nr:DivIVA domain-containing protein [Actinokineospora baliensis]MBM7771867.1 cell division septum initiation protein DivIVA [Actinokineospora baliensis]